MLGRDYRAEWREYSARRVKEGNGQTGAEVQGGRCGDVLLWLAACATTADRQRAELAAIGDALKAVTTTWRSRRRSCAPAPRIRTSRSRW